MPNKGAEACIFVKANKHETITLLGEKNTQPTHQQGKIYEHSSYSSGL